MWPGTPKDMIDHLISGYSTGLVVLIDTITSSGLDTGLLTNPDPKKGRCENCLQILKLVNRLFIQTTGYLNCYLKPLTVTQILCSTCLLSIKSGLNSSVGRHLVNL